MSTNYFILTKNKELLTIYGLNAEVTDTPDWGYWVHILQLCPGCVPLFQAHKNVRSLPDVSFERCPLSPSILHLS